MVGSNRLMHHFQLHGTEQAAMWNRLPIKLSYDVVFVAL